MLDDVARIINEIRRDNRSGAAELTARATKALRILADSLEGIDRDRQRRILEKYLLKLARAQPSMAPIINLVNRVELVVEETEGSIVPAVRRALAGEEGRARNAYLKIAENFYARLPASRQPLSIAVYSYSSTVSAALLYAAKRGRELQVVCGEGRPVGEGINMARRLGEGGIDCLLVTDAALFDMVEDCRLVAVGADSVSRLGVVNKIGTKALALAARAARVPVYCLTSKDKLLPDSLLSWFEIAERAPGEIYRGRLPRVRVANRYFGSVPLEYIARFFCEDGVLTAAAMRRLLGRQRAARLLKRGARS